MARQRANVMTSFCRDEFAKELALRVRSEVGDPSELKAPFAYSVFSVLICGTAVGGFVSLWSIHDFVTRLLVASLLALAIVVVGTSVGHESNHNASSTANTWNRLLGFVAYDVVYGLSSFYWRYYHNILHHVQTNMHRDQKQLDPDQLLIKKLKTEPVLSKRFAKLLFFLSANVVYSSLYFDYIRLSRNSQGIKNNPRELALFVSGRIITYSLSLIVPAFTIGLGAAVATYLYIYLLASLLLGCIFLIAHNAPSVEEYHLSSVPLNFSWEEAQIRSTVNYSMDQRLTTLLHGGLNYQIEHHLYPTVHPHYYPRISNIIRDLCAKYKIRYVSYPSVRLGLQDGVRTIMQA